MEDPTKDVQKIMERVDINHSGNIDYMGTKNSSIF